MKKFSSLERLEYLNNAFENGIDMAHEAFALMECDDAELEDTLRDFTQASVRLSDFIQKYLKTTNK